MITFSSVFALLALVAVSFGQNDIVNPGSKGSDVVETVCSLLEASCIFEDDKLFTRRLAYVESYDGEDPKTFRQGYYGGIWQVDEVMFNVTQSPGGYANMSRTIADINGAFGIDWRTVNWTDLTKPLYSALGARLYLQYQSRGDRNGIPRATDAQAQYWINYYRPTGNAVDFIQKVERLDSDCLNAGTDIVFVLDGSGSIGITDFGKIKQFVKSVIDSFDIGFDKTRAGIVLYSSATSVTRPFDLNTYDNKTEMLAAVDRIIYPSGSTRTDLGLDMMTNVSFTAANGARPTNEGHPRIGIVLTDGGSDNPTWTMNAAKRMHDANILAFAIGVGSSLNIPELMAIASTPTCTYLILLTTGFSEIDSLVSVIEKKACEAPIILEPEEGQRTNSTLQPGGSQNCQLKVTPQGVTVKLAVLAGVAQDEVVSFYTSSTTYPTESFYEQKSVGWTDKQAVVFVTPPNRNITTMYCNYRTSSQLPTTVSIALFSGDTDLCASQPCQNNGTCADRDDSIACLCTPNHSGDVCQYGAAASLKSLRLFVAVFAVVLIAACRLQWL